MREKKFRFWDKKYLEIVEEPIGRISINEDGSIYNSEEDKTYVEDERYVILQYTGLKDKNGKMIYEGDVIKYKFLDKPKEAEIIWDKYDCCFYPRCIKNSVDSETFRKDSMFQITPHRIEIIGNIYENPELLKNYKN